MNRSFLLPTLAAGLLATAAAQAQSPAANWPSKPVRILIPFTAGGPLDALTRAYTEPMAKKYPASMGERSPLKREAQAILGRNLSVPELQSFDTDQLLNRNCQVVVVHQHNGGSKPKAVIKTVLAAPLASTPVPTPTPTVTVG